MEGRMIILGIDPGLARMGWAIADINRKSATAIAYGCLETPKTQRDEDRLATLYTTLKTYIEKYAPSCIAMEQLFFSHNQTTAFEVSQARGVVCLLAGLHHIPTVSYAPTQIKLTVVGYGKAEKKQVQLMVKTLYNLKQVPKPDDTADALAVAYTAGVITLSQEKQ